MESREELVRQLAIKAEEFYEIGKKLGYYNILEKAKWKEEIMGMILGDRVFPDSTGEVKGADAENKESGEYREYKTSELKDEKQLDRFLCSIVEGTKTFSGSMTYNNAYTKENVNSYKDFGHYHGVFFRGELICITRVDTDYVTSDKGLMARIIKQDNGVKYKSTNGNGVQVHYENCGVRDGEGKVVHINDIRK